jgi:hypothetical protein
MRGLLGCNLIVSSRASVYQKILQHICGKLVIKSQQIRKFIKSLSIGTAEKD